MRVKTAPVTFADLAVGEVFEFDHTGNIYHERDAHGPWVKVDDNTFRQEGDDATAENNTPINHPEVRVHGGEDCNGPMGESMRIPDRDAAYLGRCVYELLAGQQWNVGKFDAIAHLYASRGFPLVEDAPMPLPARLVAKAMSE
jgi:hypothetical protein